MVSLRSTFFLPVIPSRDRRRGTSPTAGGVTHFPVWPHSKREIPHSVRDDATFLRGVFPFVLPFSLYLQSPLHRLIIATHVGDQYRFRPLLTTIQVFETMMRALASSLFRWLTVAVYGSKYSWPGEVGFPAAWQNAVWAFRGRRATGCASIDALRPFNNSVNIEEKHEISFIRETFAPFARRVPTTGRSSALSKRAGESTQENILAENRGFFRKRRKWKETGARFTQWFASAAAAFGAQA